MTPTFPNTVIEMPNFATDSSAVVAPPPRTFMDSIAHAAYEQAGIGPDDVDVAEVYDLATALELDWYEHLGAVRARARPRSCCATATPPSAAGCRSTRAAGWPASARRCRPRPSPRCASSSWQLRGEAGGRQVEGAKVGITANKGLFGHGSSVLLST